MTNKGEWAEHYAFFKVISDQKLVALDKDKNLINNLYYDVIEIVRDYRLDTECRFQISPSKIEILDKSGQIIGSELISKFTKAAEEIKREILSGKISSEVLDNIITFENSLGIMKMKAKSTEKADIVIKVHDFKTNLQPELAFSIKSQWGSSATLVNAGKSTNFIFNVCGALDHEDIENFNATKKFNDKYQSIKEMYLDFEKCSNDTFEDNLLMIDTLMPKILASILKEYYFGSFESTGKRISTIPSLVNIVA